MKMLLRFAILFSDIKLSANFIVLFTIGFIFLQVLEARGYYCSLSSDQANYYGSKGLDRCSRESSYCRVDEGRLQPQFLSRYDRATIRRYGPEAYIRMPPFCNPGMLVDYGEIIDSRCRSRDIVYSWADKMAATAAAIWARDCGVCPPDGWFDTWRAAFGYRELPNSLDRCLSDECDDLFADVGTELESCSRGVCEAGGLPAVMLDQCRYFGSLLANMLANNYGHCTSHAGQIFRDYVQRSDLDFGQGQGFIGLQDSSPNPNTISGASAIADLARLAENVYGDEHDAGINVRRVGGGFFHRIDTADNLLSGFDAATYVDREHGDAVIVFRGTEPDSVTDWLTDVDALLNPSRLPPQYVQAITYARDMYRELRTQGYNVIITGHSLGGALAEVAHQQTGATTVTFNQAAAPKRTWSEWLTGAPERRTRDNLLRVFDQADPVHDIWDPRRSRFEGGQNYTPGELESLRLPFGITVPRTSIPRHEMEAMQEYWEGVHKRNCLRMRGLSQYRK